MNPHHKHIQAICKMLRSCAYRHDLHTLFSDCMEAAAIALSNSVDLASRDARERRYLDIVGRYERSAVEIFPRVLAEVVLALEAQAGDVLSSTRNSRDRRPLRSREEVALAASLPPASANTAMVPADTGSADQASASIPMHWAKTQPNRLLTRLAIMLTPITAAAT